LSEHRFVNLQGWPWLLSISIASYVPEEGHFTIEEATAWEPGEIDEEVGYALAVDTREYGIYDTPEAAAEALLALAREHDLLPSITLLFEEDEVS